MRERLAGGRRDRLQSTLRMTAPTAGSRTINRACAESFDTWIRVRSQFPSVQLPPPSASLSCVLFSFGAASHIFSLSKVYLHFLLPRLDLHQPSFLPNFWSLVSFITSNDNNIYISFLKTTCPMRSSEAARGVCSRTLGVVARESNLQCEQCLATEVQLCQTV